MSAPRVSQPYRDALTRLNISAIAWPQALRNSLGIAIVFTILALTGHPHLIPIAGLGGMNVSFSDRAGTDPTKIPRMLFTALMAACTVALGSLLGAAPFLAFSVGAILALPLGMLVMFGPGAGQTGVTGFIAYVIATMQPGGWHHALTLFGIVIVVGSLQTLLAVTIGHPRVPDRFAFEIAPAFRHLAMALRGDQLDPGEAPGAIALSTAWQSLATIIPNDTTRLRERLLTSGQAMQSHVLAAAHEREAAADATPAEIDATRLALADRLDRFAEAIATLRPVRVSDPEVEHSPIAPPTPSHHTVMGRTLTALEREINHTQDIWQDYITIGTTKPARPKQNWRAHRVTNERLIRGNLRLESPYFRHGLRMAICVAIAALLARLSGVGHIAWAPLTVAAALKPDFYSTSSRALTRIVGTEIGLAIGTGLLLILPDGIGTHIMLLIVFATITKVLWPTNAVIGATCISAYVVLIMSVVGVSSHEAFIDRTMQTFIGGAVAVVVFILWPTWDRKNAPRILRQMVAEFARGYDTLMNSHLDPSRFSEAEVHDQRARMRWARSVAADLAGRLSTEPGTSLEFETRVKQVIADMRNIAMSLLAQESYFLQHERDRVPVAFHPYVRALSATLGSLGMRVSATDPRANDLDRAQHAIQRDARLRADWPGLLREAQATAELVRHLADTMHVLTHVNRPASDTTTPQPADERVAPPD